MVAVFALMIVAMAVTCTASAEGPVAQTSAPIKPGSLSLQGEGKLNLIEAKEVDYDGNKIRLSGKVHIIHQMGEIYCDRAVLILPKAEKSGHKNPKANQKLAPERIIMDGQVKMILGDGSSLSSDEADIDCVKSAGMFVANRARKVIYTTPKTDNDPPMKATSRTMYVVLEKVANGSGSRYAVSDLKASDSVQIEYLELEGEKQENNG